MSDHISFHDQISRNKTKSFFLLAAILVVLMVLGYVIAMIADPTYFTFIMILAIIISISYIWIGYYNSHKIAIASVRAKKASQTEYADYHNTVEGLCLASGMPKPELYVMPDSNINAFASGRDPKNAVICVTEGALARLDKHELEGVLAHELSHIANYDIRFMTLTAVLVGMVAIISEIFLRSLFWGGIGSNDRDNKAQIIMVIVGIALAIIAPIVVMMVQLAISRKREFSADASAVKFIRSPTGLKNALKKIQDENQPSTKQKHKYNKAVAPLFISDPYKKSIKGLFQTHPPLQKRIAILERM